jgi:uncharacterized protein YceK
MIRLFICIFALMILSGCSTVAKRSDGETLTIKGMGKAKWTDGAEIEGKSWWPELPTIRYD